MNIKYSLNRTLFNQLLLAFLLCCSFNVNGQISGGEVKPDQDKKDKKNKKEKTTRVKPAFERDSLSGTVYYLTGMLQHSFRTFEDNSVYSVYQRNLEEVPMITGGTTLGLIMPLNKNFGIDAGITFFGHGEAYNYSDPNSDSINNYSNVYMQVGIPLKLRYTYGEDFQVFGYAGITPLNILNVRNKYEYADSVGTRVNGLRSIKEGFSSFNFMASAGLGVNYYINHFGFTLSAEYRRHLMNTYAQDTFKRVHKMYGIGINFGIQIRI